MQDLSARWKTHVDKATRWYWAERRDGLDEVSAVALLVVDLANALDALQEIAEMDYRGNRSTEQRIAQEALNRA